MNYGVIATGNHYYFYSLREAQPLLCTTPPKADRPEDFNNQAEMCRFPPIRPQMYRQRNSFESAAGVSKGGAFAPSAPLADFFGYFLVQRQESNIVLLS